MEKKKRMDEQKDEQNTLTCPHVCAMLMLTFVWGTHKIIQTHPLATVISTTIFFPEYLKVHMYTPDNNLKASSNLVFESAINKY